LLTGPEELLLRRAAERLLDELRELGDLEVIDLRASDLRDSGLPDLRTASLFGGARAVLLREAQDLPAEAAAALLAEYEGDPARHAGIATVVLLANAAGRIQKLARRAKELGGRIDVNPPKDWEDRKWSALVVDEFRRHQCSADPSAVAAVLAHAGLDVGAIAEKVAQAAAAAAGGRVTAAQVNAVVVGHGNRGTFAVADAMCDRRPADALSLLRGALDAGNDPVLVLGALAYRLRSIVAVAAGLDPKAVGLNLTPGQARRLSAVRRNFGPGELTAAYRTLADADREIKGGELPAALVLERAVVAIATRP
jgi:DNA polymerase-3 subunit delta